jgi:hypothetical protein
MHLVDQVVLEGLLLLSVCLWGSVFLLVDLCVAIEEVLAMVVCQVQRLFLLGTIIIGLVGFERSVKGDLGVVNTRILLLDCVEGSKDFVVQVGSS